MRYLHSTVLPAQVRPYCGSQKCEPLTKPAQLLPIHQLTSLLTLITETNKYYFYLYDRKYQFKISTIILIKNYVFSYN